MGMIPVIKPSHVPETASDAVKTLLGLSGDATLNDVLAALAGTVPLSRGGTGNTSAASALYTLINGAAALTNTGLAVGDYVPIGDISAATGKKISLTNFVSYLQTSQSMAKIQTGSYVGTGTYGVDNPCNLTFDFVPQFLLILNKSRPSFGSTSSWWNAPFVFAFNGMTETYLQSDKNGRNIWSWSGKKVSWYSTNGSEQYNYQNDNYGYVSFG